MRPFTTTTKSTEVANTADTSNHLTQRRHVAPVTRTRIKAAEKDFLQCTAC